VIDIPWDTTVANDRRLVDPRGSRGLMTRFMQWYMGKLHVAARRDPGVALAFLSVAGLLAPAPSVLRPTVALRVMRGNLPWALAG
jgi:hypothetical protein